MFCHNCGKQVPKNAFFCDRCGAKLLGTGSPDSPNSAGLGKNGPRNSSVAAVLALLLGLLGAHDFYCGNTKHGVVKLILTLTGIASIISFVWSVIDLIHLGKGTYIDGDGCPLAPVSWLKWVALLIAFVSLVYVACMGVLVWILISYFVNSYSELGLIAQEYKARQATYLAAKGRFGDVADIGFLVPNSENFRFHFSRNRMQFESKKMLGDCPQRTKWELRVISESEEMFTICGLAEIGESDESIRLDKELQKMLEEKSPDKGFASTLKKVQKMHRSCEKLAKPFFSQCDSVVEANVPMNADSLFWEIAYSSTFYLKTEFSRYLDQQKERRRYLNEFGSWRLIDFYTLESDGYVLEELRQNNDVGISAITRKKIAGCPANSRIILSNNKKSRGSWKCKIESENNDACIRLYEGAGFLDICEWMQESSQNGDPQNTWHIVE